jgi:hypothetical protein
MRWQLLNKALHVIFCNAEFGCIKIINILLQDITRLHGHVLKNANKKVKNMELLFLCPQC